MAERDFYNINDFIAYPLVDTDTDGNDFALVGGGYLPRQGLADAGFVLGHGSGFVVAQHNVYLNSIEVTVSEIKFHFESDAPGLAGLEWLFAFPLTAALGCSDYVGVTPVGGGSEDQTLGYGYINVGELADLIALGIDDHVLVTPARVEPALLQSLVNTFATSINVADDLRECPAACCESSSSSSSSSDGVDDAILVGSGLMGAVKLKAGYNCTVTVNTVLNSIIIGAGVGLGQGEVCNDIVVDQDGLRVDDCTNCDGFVSSINGVVSPTGKLVLSGGAGLVVVAYPLENKLVVKVEVTKDCTSSSSSSSV